ncbi:G-type lectin S-receptor-like serine/threonine-protein kinase [Actinidia chinensis var. chinensis]|uniref:Receptor-like serine/threonine-protein kinase n=1 Tax=Actinidia chinensis var. chinensis TaxID=1590841 RepID=A0A2R6QDU5_ACTCC|nr:G-type lectin S-receptor-like serine/threonine-protein kinase [Actinidia chinensis var. chinensis]
MKAFNFIFLCSLILSSLLEFSFGADTITSDQSITVDETLVSSSQIFVLGFFPPSGSNNWFLGIWYKSSPQTVVWVANREKPLTDSNGTLAINGDGNLVLLNGSKSIVWSSNSSRAMQNSVAQLLDSGNLVLKSDINTESYIWQSFYYPSDTLLQGMKMGWDIKAGLNRYLTSWKDANDPSPGEFTYRIDMDGLPQFVFRKGSKKKFRSGPWNGVRFSGTELSLNLAFNPIFVITTDEVYYGFKSNGVSTRLVAKSTGLLQRFILHNGSSEWALMYTVQDDLCNIYGQCGVNGICKISKAPICECLQGFVPKSQSEWGMLDWSSGCARKTPLDCHKGERFLTLRNVKLPDLLDFWVDKSMNPKDCKAECLKNCNCTAYATLEFSRGGGGCLIWFGDLLDIRELTQENPQNDVFIRMPASELGPDHTRKKKIVVMVAVVSAACGMLVLSLLCWWIIWKRAKRTSLKTEKEDIELPLFDLVTVATATNNFSSAQMVGEGGFGHVYKGKLPLGQEIAVKRLSKTSGQGLQEFKNEVLMISRLQHRNLVRLLGCCIQGEERMLIYEYMPNKSLDYFIFDCTRRGLLKWPKRFDVSMGIARGILYLHQDSRLRIIHRDLKTSNILLDSELEPKISDFGIARIFVGDQIEAKTKRVIGTYGYMSPEYAIDGKFSVKSDVFGLGVLLLEIVSGQKNRNFRHPDHHHTLLGHAWLLWEEGKALELMDSCLEDSYVESQVLRCIQVGLLCVQKLPQDRPDMPLVVFMLGNEGVMLPKQPGFFVERNPIDLDASTNEDGHRTANLVTITKAEGR